MVGRRLAMDEGAACAARWQSESAWAVGPDAITCELWSMHLAADRS